MRSKLMATLLMTVLGLMVMPLALDQLNNLQGLAEKWTRSTFLNGIVTVNASAAEVSAQSEPPASGKSAGVGNSAEEFHWAGRVASGDTVEIRGINGNLSAEPSATSEVEVNALKSGRRSDPKGVEIRVVEHSGGVTICAVYPSDDPNHPNDCQPGGEVRSSVRDNDVRVDFTVRVPQGVRFRGRTVNGDVETGAIGGDVEAATVNGNIKVSAAGSVQAKTVNGSINASLGNANGTSPLEFKTVNGGITVSLPANTSAEVRADTLNGNISTDFPLTVQNQITRRHLSGTIGGGGGRELLLKTVNGDIQLRRAS